MYNIDKLYNKYSPAFFIIAFCDEEFDRKLAALGHKLDDIVSIGCGGYITEKDIPLWNRLHKAIEYLHRREARNKLEEKIISILADYEYAIALSPEDAEEVIYSRYGIKPSDEVFIKAHHKYLIDFERCNG